MRHDPAQPLHPDVRMERLVGRVLRVGTTVSTICLAAGVIWSLASGSPDENLAMSVGLVVLLATPAARVVGSVVGYALERDWVFAALTFIVLLELGAAVVAGLLGA